MICFVDISVHPSAIYYRFSYLSGKSASLCVSDPALVALLLLKDRSSDSCIDFYEHSFCVSVCDSILPLSLTLLCLSLSHLLHHPPSTPLSLSLCVPLNQAFLSLLSQTRTSPSLSLALSSQIWIQWSTFRHHLFLTLCISLSGCVCVCGCSRQRKEHEFVCSLYTLSSYDFSLYMRKHKLLHTY